MSADPQRTAGRATEAPGPPLTTADSRRLRDFIRRETGISLSEGKEALLKARLSPRLRDLRLPSFREYVRLVIDDGDSRERTRLFNCIVTGETHFFREPKQFRYLAQRVLPAWRAEACGGRRSRLVRVWSAGCATGEEPFSLAMFLSDHLPASAGWRVQILGTDLSTAALERARAAIWPLDKAREIPHVYRQRYMLRGTGRRRGQMAARPELHPLIDLQWLNLNQEPYAQIGCFDLVFCRNVLIYFGLAEKTKVLGRVIRHVDPRGYLFVGNAENLAGLTDRLRAVIPSVYAPVERQGLAAAGA